MLNNVHQIEAYKLLQTTPLKTASSVLQATDTQSKASAKATSLTALKSATVTYPASITAQVTKLTTWAALMTRAGTVCGTFTANVTPYQVPTNMIELYNGWDVYLKVAALPADTPLRANTAVADTTVVAALQTAVTGLDITALSTAWTTINTALVMPPAVSGQPAPVQPTLTQAQIDALVAAMTAAEPKFTAMTALINAVDTLGTNAKMDGDKANDAFHRAVDVAVLTNIASNDILTDSLKAIVSPAVYQALADANSDS
jgi:hypothetical protein